MKSNNLLLITLVIVLAEYARSADNPNTVIDCRKEVDGKRLVDPDSCSFYYFCNGGIALKKSCPIGFHYDDVNSQCNYASLVNCKRNLKRGLIEAVVSPVLQNIPARKARSNDISTDCIVPTVAPPCGCQTITPPPCSTLPSTASACATPLSTVAPCATPSSPSSGCASNPSVAAQQPCVTTTCTPAPCVTTTKTAAGCATPAPASVGCATTTCTPAPCSTTTLSTLSTTTQATTVLPSTRNDVVEFVPHSRSNRMYYVILRNGKKRLHKCRKGLRFDLKTKSCKL